MKLIRDAVQKYFTKWLLTIFQHPKLRDMHSERDLRRYADRGAKVTDFLLAVGTFFAMQWLFRRFMEWWGYERTVIIALVLIAFLLRNFLEVSGRPEKHDLDK